MCAHQCRDRAEIPQCCFEPRPKIRRRIPHHENPVSGYSGRRASRVRVLGYIASLARPGANVTGIFFRHIELTSKRLELFKEMLPGVSRVTVLADAESADQFREVEAANRSLGLKLQVQDL